MQKIACPLPEWSQTLFQPARYKTYYGGRGASRSWTVARALLVLGSSKRLRILCVRELQRSIADSVHKLLSDQIELIGLPGWRITQRTIEHVVTGTTFIFEGIKQNVTKIKSLEGIDICWVEEAERISKESWEVLIPTIRKEGSEIWITFNPYLETDPTYDRFVLNAEPDWITLKLSWRDNPWFPDVLRKDMEYLYRVDPEAAEHVWGGECIKTTAASILNGKWVVEPFTPDESYQGPYHGADFGFAVDPTTAVRLWTKKRVLYVEYESYQVGLDTDKIKVRWQRDVPNIHKFIIRADSARPETISYLKKQGLNKISPVIKWKGSVEDGVAYLRQFERIVIHPRCINTIQEARLWSYKVDKQTGEILPEVADKHNHIWDAVRYALAPIIRLAKGSRTGYKGQSYATS